MVIEKEKIKKKLIDDYNNNIEHSCVICGERINVENMIDGNFVYCETVYGENYAHATCIKK